MRASLELINLIQPTFFKANNAKRSLQSLSGFQVASIASRTLFCRGPFWLFYKRHELNAVTCFPLLKLPHSYEMQGAER